LLYVVVGVPGGGCGWFGGSSICRSGSAQLAADFTPPVVRFTGLAWKILKALECINYQSLSSSRFDDISESPSVPWRFHGHRVVLCRFPAKKEKGDIELLQHIACLDVRPQTRTAKKKYQQKPQARTLKTSTHPFLRCWNMFHSSHSQVHSMNPWTKTRIWSPGPTFSVLKSWRAAASATGSSSDNLVRRIWQRYSELSKSPHFG